ncbi:hypothetical protein NQZ68_023139 [Dissostichus eleginoides]|nr:hypothetical protein NQZ68_023139 [Dissostichus eleginoides]
MWVFMRGHLQNPASSVSFVQASELGGGQRGEPEGQTQGWESSTTYSLRQQEMLLSMAYRGEMTPLNRLLPMLSRSPRTVPGGYETCRRPVQKRQKESESPQENRTWLDGIFRAHVATTPNILCVEDLQEKSYSHRIRPEVLLGCGGRSVQGDVGSEVKGMWNVEVSSGGLPCENTFEQCLSPYPN